MPNPSLERTSTGRAAWPLRGQSHIVPSRARRLCRFRPAQLERWAVKSIAAISAFIVTSAVRGEMSLGRWLEQNEPKVRAYLLALRPEQIGTNVSGVKLSEGKREISGYRYLANLSQPSRGLYMFKFGYTYRGNQFEAHYIWVAKGHRSHDLNQSPLCSGNWIEPGGWGVLSGDQYTYQEAQPGENIVVTTCQLTLPNPSINTDAAR